LVGRSDKVLMPTRRMTRRRIYKLLVLALLVSLTCASCKSNVNMYRHNRSHCDCPTF